MGTSATSLTVRIPGGGRPSRYPIVIGSGLLRRLPRILSKLGRPSRLHLISDERVWKSWGRRLSVTLNGGGVPWSRTVVPPGERSKSVGGIDRVWRDLVRSGCDRRSWVVAFGGGVVGDLAGFAASSVLRGLPFVQVPTTLLAMVDASVGGKTGINLPEGKNLVGAFHQPLAVVIDLDLLRTLPAREARAGWAEVIKTAAIRDAGLFRFLRSRRESLLSGEAAGLRRVVRACCRIKARVVEEDEREGGVRMLLNFGHTLGHAIEAASGYQGLLHGEAVAIGMTFAARLGEAMGASEPGTAARLESLLQAFGLPTVPGRVRLPVLLRALERDKKRGARGLRWVVLERIGRAVVREDIPWEAARAAIHGFAGRVGSRRNNGS
jgi:3-dehydroquinate synthase